MFAIANLSWVLLTQILPVLREQREGNRSINQNSGLAYFNEQLGDANQIGARAQNSGDRRLLFWRGTGGCDGLIRGVRQKLTENPVPYKKSDTNISGFQSRKRIRKTTQAVAIRYRESNREVYDEQGGSSNIRIHHKWPLFLDGPDAEDNMVFLTKEQHLAWHGVLYAQGKTGNMLFDPIGTVYCVTQ